MRKALYLIILLIPACAPDDRDSQIIKTPTVEEFDALVKNNPVVLVDFQADWCGPCKTMKPIIRGLEKDYRGQVKVVEVDIDQRPELARAFGVSSIPRFIVFRDGQPLERSITGSTSRQQLVGLLETALKK